MYLDGGSKRRFGQVPVGHAIKEDPPVSHPNRGIQEGGLHPLWLRFFHEAPIFLIMYELALYVSFDPRQGFL